MTDIDFNKIKLDLISNGSISHDSLESLTPSHLKLPLTSYQLQTIQAMKVLEDNDCSLGQNTCLKTSFGVLCNKAGSGKSFCILGLISLVPQLKMKETIISVFSEQIAIIRKNTNKRIINTNLIVIPSGLLFTVWIPYIKNFTTLKFDVITKQSNSLIDLDYIDTLDCLLCPSKMYNIVIKMSTDMYWNRVVFDESDSISLPSCKKPNSIFTWFVTSSAKNLMFPNGNYWKNDNGLLSRVLTDGIKNNGWIKNTFKSLQKCNSVEILANIFIKVSDDYIDKITQLPNIQHIKHLCKSPYYVNILYDLFDDVEPLFANDCKFLMRKNGIIYESHINLLICNIFKFLKKQLKNSIIKLNYLLSLETNEIEVNIIQQKKDKVKENIENIRNQMKKIENRIRQLDCESIDDECPICMKPLKNNEPCLLLCCKNFICFNCITTCISNDYVNCALCRSSLKDENIIKFIKNNCDNLDKISTIHKIVNMYNVDSDFRCLVFSLYDDPLQSITFNNISYKKPNVFTKRLLDLYNTGKIKILLLNANHYSCGINLINTTDIIFFHKMNNELSNQIIGRAQRYGRTSNLRVHELYYEQEHT